MLNTCLIAILLINPQLSHIFLASLLKVPFGHVDYGY